MNKDTEWAWATGLFEGEGCIAIRQMRGKPWVQLCVNMTEPDVLNRFRDIMGCGNVVSVKKRAAGVKQMYSWTSGARADVERILCAMRPLLGERRGAKADEALDTVTRNK